MHLIFTGEFLASDASEGQISIFSVCDVRRIRLEQPISTELVLEFVLCTFDACG